MEVHIGQEIEKKFQQSGLKLAEFARRINSSTRNVYTIFKRPALNSAQLKLIGEVLNFDFFTLYHEYELPQGIKRESVLITVELDGLATTLAKSIAKLERINAALS